VSRSLGPPGNDAAGPKVTLPGTGPSASTTGKQHDGPILAERADDPEFRRWQAGWLRRIQFSRRLAPYDRDRVDPAAPSGRWGR
jgi:hypothetical protein